MPSAAHQSLPEPEIAPLLTLRGVTKIFPAVVAVDRVDLSIAPGEIVGLALDSARLSLAALVGYFLYCTLLESSAWQATVGKRALGLKVTSARGERIGFARAAVRFAAKLLSVLTLCLGFLLIFVTQRREGRLRTGEVERAGRWTGQLARLLPPCHEAVASGPP